MGRLINAEWRKIVTTRLWWALLIPAVVVAFFWAFFAAKLTTTIAEGIRTDPTFQQLGVNFQNGPWSVFAFSRAVNITTIFPMLFGALGLSSELHRRTITTSFLTAPNRASMLGAKGVAYLLWGLMYGVLISALAWLGTLAGSGGRYLPDFGPFLLLAASGVLATVLWTLFGLGVGALLGSTTGSIVLLLIYTIVAEPILDLFLHNHVAGSLPNGAADGLTGSTAAQIIIDRFQSSQIIGLAGQSGYDAFVALIRVAAGAIGSFAWWASGLVFLAWTAVFFFGGMFVNQRRDIT